MSQKVYIIQEGNSNFYKIGQTISSVELRKSALQTGNKIKLYVVKVFECNNSKKLEKSLHEYFKEKHIMGEWFELSVDDINMLDEIVNTVKSINKAKSIKQLTNKLVKKQNNYVCECCEYETKRRLDYLKHLESIKHKNNLTDTTKQIYICDGCDKELTSKSNLTRHQNLYCSSISKKLENITKKDLEILELKYQLQLKEALYESKLKEAHTQLECETKIKEVIIDSHKNLIEELKTDKAKLEYNVDNMADIAKRSITALTYCRKNFPKAPPLMELEHHEPPKLLLDAVPKGIDIAKYLIDLYEDSDKVSPLIANIIIAKYKKKDPTKMSFWNADHARHNFVFVDMLNGVAQWENDKDAIHIRSKVVDPMLTHVREMLVDFNLRITDDLANKNKSQLDEDLTEGVLISNLSNVSKYQNRCMNMINRLDDKSLSNSIIKLIGAEFQIKYDAIEREIEK
jgi:hypothetical protein